MAIAGPLNGVTVVELGNQVAAATCTRMMADLGANIIKVENTAGVTPIVHGPVLSVHPLRTTSTPSSMFSTQTRELSPSTLSPKAATRSCTACWKRPIYSSPMYVPRV